MHDEFLLRRALLNLRGSWLWSIGAPLHRSLRGGVLGRLFPGAGESLDCTLGRRPPRKDIYGPAPKMAEGELRSVYCSSGRPEQATNCVLYRIIGNDLVPRHRRGQSRDNLRFVIEHEAELPGCEKQWILNRIVDPAEHTALRELLHEHRQEFIDIPYLQQEYAACDWDMAGLPTPGYTMSSAYAQLPPSFRARLHARLYRHKNNYVVHNNGARNVALEHGRSRAEWVLPWDGNCFLTRAAWEEISGALHKRPWYPYAVVPMARVTNRGRLLEDCFRTPAHEEPQIIFRSDAAARFDPEYYYGRRPKVELLWRLGVPGPWDTWAADPWDLPYPPHGADAGAWQNAGWVARLPSGGASAAGELDRGHDHQTRRLGAREQALTDLLAGLDAELLRQRLSGRKPPFVAELDASSASAASRHNLRRHTGPEGTRFELNAALSAAQQERYHELSLHLLYLRDRANFLFGRPGGECFLLDADHRRIWRQCEELFAACDLPLWVEARRPENINT